MNDLQKLFNSELNAIQQGERQLIQALPRICQLAESPELKRAFAEHTEQSNGHVARLDQVFAAVPMSPQHKPCHGLAGLVDETLSVAEDFRGHPALDAALVAAGQKLAHYEISAYGTLSSWAEELGIEEPSRLLQDNLKEAKQLDASLARLAEAAATSGVKPGLTADLRILFLRYLRTAFDAEHLLVIGLNELHYYAASAILKLAIRQHRAQTEKHAERLEKVFSQIGETADRKPCEGAEGILDDAQVSVMEFLGNSALDAALICAAQKAEHYEITTYNSLLLWAHKLGFDEITSLLEDNLSDEISADKKLTFAAEFLRNPKAKKSDRPKRAAEEAEFLKLATHAG